MYHGSNAIAAPIQYAIPKFTRKAVTSPTPPERRAVRTTEINTATAAQAMTQPVASEVLIARPRAPPSDNVTSLPLHP